MNYIIDIETIEPDYTPDDFFEEFIQVASDSDTTLCPGKLHTLIHYGLGFSEWKTARDFESVVRKQLQPFTDKSSAGKWVGLQWKRNLPELVYPARVSARFEPAESCGGNYEEELMRLPHTLSHRQRFGIGIS